MLHLLSALLVASSGICAGNRRFSQRNKKRTGGFMIKLRHLALAAICIGALAGSALADTYPSRPIKMIVPFGAGGPADVFARVLADHLSQSLKQTVVVENRPGAGSIIGT